MSGPNPPPKPEEHYFPPPPTASGSGDGAGSAAGAPPSSQTAQQQAPPTSAAAAPPSPSGYTFPPPPPGPPPGQSAAGGAGYQYPPPPSGAPPPKQQQQQPAYTIPAYNPAHPQFAPPPADATELPGGHEEMPPADAAGEKPPKSSLHVPGTGSGATASGHSPSASPVEPGHGSRWSDKLAKFGAKAAEPVNMLVNKLGAQSFLPMSMDKECEKAAVILRSFCKDGVPTVDASAAPPSPNPLTGDAAVAEKKKHKREPSPRRALVTIPPKLIARAHGLAIFTVARVGFQLSGATGSGVVLARLPDGTWSPPSGIQVHSLGAGFLVGADIYDCVCILNSAEALAAFTNTRVSLGSDLAVAAGPWGAGGQLEWGRATAKEMPDGVNRHGVEAPQAGGEAGGTAAGQDGDPAGKLRVQDPRAGHKRSPSSGSLKPVFTYVRSRGLYAGVAVDGTVVTERKEANEKFYAVPGIDVESILRGRLPTQAKEHTAAATRSLMDAVKLAETSKSRPTSSAGAAPPSSPQQQQQPHQQQHVPGVVSVPLTHVDHTGLPPAPGAHGGLAGPSGGEQLPSYTAGEGGAGYVPDQKVTYQ